MRMMLVKPATTRINICCVKCNKTGPENTFLADLDGKPFVDYYCQPCAMIAMYKTKGE